MACGGRPGPPLSSPRPRGGPAQPPAGAGPPPWNTPKNSALDNWLRCSKCAKLSDPRKSPSGRPAPSTGRRERPNSLAQDERLGSAHGSRVEVPVNASVLQPPLRTA